MSLIFKVGKNIEIKIDTKPEILCGDINGDKEISKADSLLLQKYLDGQDVEILEYNSDLNSDGKIDEEDVEILKLYLANCFDKLPHIHKFENGKCACGLEMQ